MAGDKQSIGLSPASRQRLEELDAKGWWGDKDDIARFCMAYAIRSQVAAGTTEQPDTRWAAGNFDSTGEIRTLIRVLYPDSDTPVRLIEFLVNEGIRIVHERVVAHHASPADLMS